MIEVEKNRPATLLNFFQDTESFTQNEAEALLLAYRTESYTPDSVRAELYAAMEKGLFERIGKGLYTVTRENAKGEETTCLVINGNNRDLSQIPDNAIDGILIESPYRPESILPEDPDNRFHDALLQHSDEDFREKQRILKPGSFLVEILPTDQFNDYESLYQLKNQAKEQGLDYYAKVPWKKESTPTNPAQEKSTPENILFFTNGKSKGLSPDVQRKQEYLDSRTIVEYREHFDGYTSVSVNIDSGSNQTNEREDIDVYFKLSVDQKDAKKVTDILDSAWFDYLMGFPDSPLDSEIDANDLFQLSAQEYLVLCLQHESISYVDLTPGPEDIFRSGAKVIVNPTNLLGPMGAGLAKAFRNQYPGLEDAYKAACKSRLHSGFEQDIRRSTIEAGYISSGLYEGDLYYYPSPDPNLPDVLCFPTKKDWRDPSDLGLIEKGLDTFAREYGGKGCQSICFPKLGCGLGGLDWETKVKPLMRDKLKNLDANILICGDTLQEDNPEFFLGEAASLLPTLYDLYSPNPKDERYPSHDPVNVLKELFRFIKQEPELVFEQFAGSGVLDETALNLNYKCLYIEPSKLYHYDVVSDLSALENLRPSDPKVKDAIQTVLQFSEALYSATASEDPSFMEAFTMSKEGEKLSGAIRTLTYFSRNLDGAEGDIYHRAIRDLRDLTELSERKRRVLECSGQGDKRFSAHHVQITIHGKTATIEDFYQNAKRDAHGKIPGKGKPAEYFICPFSKEKLPAAELPNLYKGLWIAYFSKRPELVQYASTFDEYHDTFHGIRSEICQTDVIRDYVANPKRFTENVRHSLWYETMANKRKYSLHDMIMQAAHGKQQHEHPPNDAPVPKRNSPVR